MSQFVDQMVELMVMHVLLNVLKKLFFTKGVCKYKCSKVENKSIIKVCRKKTIGKNTYRKRCCTYNNSNGKRIKIKCEFVGKPVSIKNKIKCSWFKKSKNTKQRRCCRWTVRKVDKIVKKTRPKCAFIGKPLKIQHLKLGCSFRTYGKNGRRKYCCRVKRNCKGNRCKSKRYCKFTGKTITNRQYIKCRWVHKTPMKKQQYCCTYNRKCVISKKTKKCKKNRIGCSYRGLVIRTKRVTKCHMRKYGRYSTKKRCCSWNPGFDKKKSLKLKVKCSWVGKRIYERLFSKCSIRNKSRGVQQLLCCSWIKKCLGKSCKKLSKKCNWKGKLYITKRNIKCKWRRIRHNTLKRYCCKITSKCKGKACRKVGRKCRFIGSSISKRIVTQCKWKRYSRFQMRKNCCQIRKICRGKKCRKQMGSCRWIGYIISKKISRKCAWKKLGSYAKRLRCCSRTKRCHSKLGKCRVIGKKCHWSSKLIKNIPKKHCYFKRYGNGSSRRKRCCTWKNYCIGNQCRPVGKKCIWTGFIYKKVLKSYCNWKRKSKFGIQRKCCKYFRVCRILNKRRQCKNGKKVCKWRGAQIFTKFVKNCRYEPVGINSRRKLCCRHKRVCAGNVCRRTRKRCGFTGPTYTMHPITKCHWHRINQVQLRRRCCSSVKHCINNLCKISKRKCQYTGKRIVASKHKKCVWKALRSKLGYSFRKRYCCVFRKLTGKIVKNTCGFVGKRVLIKKKYWKKRKICSKSYPNYTCCTSAFRCVQVGKKHKCKYFKKLQCKIYRRARVTTVKVERKCSISKNKKTCCNYKYKCVGSRSYRRKYHKKCKLITKNKCSSENISKKLTYVCSSVGDPHYQTFSKVNFNFYTPGDWVLAKSKSFRVSTRTKKWNAASVNVRISAVVNKAGEKVEIKAANYDQIKINNKKFVTLPTGKKYSFYYGGSITRVSPTQFQITSSNGDVLEAYTFNMGAYGKKIGAPFIMNLYLKTSKKNRYQGLCSASNQVIHSKDFSKEYIFKGTIKPKPCTGEVREKIVKKCQEFKGFMKFGCVVDLCSNIPKEIEEIANIEKKRMKDVKLITPGVVVDRKRLDASQLNPGNGNMCISWGDPHFTSFKGTKFNNYHLGDHLLLKTKRFTIQVRQRRWGSASVNTLFAARIKNTIIETNKPDSFLLNRKERLNIKIGQIINLKNDGKIERIEKDRWLLTAKNGGYADIVFNYYGGKLRVGSNIYQRRYINFIIKVPNPSKAKGFCAGQIIRRSTLFSKPYLSKHKSTKIKLISNKCKRASRLRCLNRHVKKGDLNNCVFDLCNGFSAKNIRKFEKNLKRDTRKWNRKTFNRKLKKSRKNKKVLKRRRRGFIFKRISRRRRSRKNAKRMIKRRARRCCRKLKNKNKRKECKRDFIRTGSCLIHQYKVKK